MRITNLEKKVFLKTIQNYDPIADIYLFGSRVDDSLKEGDIDLLIASDNLGFSEKISILTDIKRIIGDQKIDLLIMKKAELTINPFVRTLVIKKLD